MDDDYTYVNYNGYGKWFLIKNGHSITDDKGNLMEFIGMFQARKYVEDVLGTCLGKPVDLLNDPLEQGTLL